MKGHGVSGGALTVVNAIAAGFGAAFGIGLSTRAEYSCQDEGDVSLTINGVTTDTTFVSALLDTLRAARPNADIAGAAIATVSDIPQSMGLKSSSAAANAILLAADDALHLGLSETEILTFGARASIAAHVSVTGAFDDASACLLGGLVFTNNTKMEILKRVPMPDEYAVVIRRGTFAVPTGTFPRDRFVQRKEQVQAAFAEALDGRVFDAMYANGRLAGEALGVGTETADRALACGAAAAGLSGTGPAVGILVQKDGLDAFLERFGAENCIITTVRNGRAQ